MVVTNLCCHSAMADDRMDSGRWRYHWSSRYLSRRYLLDTPNEQNDFEEPATSRELALSCLALVDRLNHGLCVLEFLTGSQRLFDEPTCVRFVVSEY